MQKSERNVARSSFRPNYRRRIRRSGKRFRQAIVVFSSIIVLGTILLLTSVIVEQRQSAEERARNDTANLSAAFEEQVRRVINSVHGAMALLKPELATEGAAFDLVDWTAHVPEFAASAVQVSFVGPDGRLIASSLVPHTKALNFADREHVRVHLTDPRSTIFVSKPVVGRVSGQITIQVSDRVIGPDGKLLGVVIFALSPEFLTTLHHSVNLGKSGSMILAGTDGVIRASFAGDQRFDHAYIGTSISDSRALRDSGTSSSGAYEAGNPFNGEPTYFHWRKVGGYPLIVIVGLSKHEVFAVANRSAQLLVILGAIVLALTLAMTLILHQEIVRRVQREIALFDESYKVFRANGNLQRRHRQLLATSAALSAERGRLERLNAELNTAKEQADQANQAKTSLLNNISHEFRTPMHAILNYASMGLKKLNEHDLDKLQKYLDNIQTSGFRLLGMLNALLDLAKLESGKAELRLSRGDILHTVSQAQAELESLFETKHLLLHVRSDSEETCAVFDKQRIMQVFINLLSNAIKFSPNEGMVKVEITDTLLRDQVKAFHVSISDEGTGIPLSELETIFDKFAQSTKTDTGAGGSGLGLAICREIIHLHGGNIWAENAKAGGAVINFTLPKEQSSRGAVALLVYQAA